MQRQGAHGTFWQLHSSGCLERSGQARERRERKLKGQPTRGQLQRGLGCLAKSLRFDLTGDGEILKV